MTNITTGWTRQLTGLDNHSIKLLWLSLIRPDSVLTFQVSRKSWCSRFYSPPPPPLPPPPLSSRLRSMESTYTTAPPCSSPRNDNNVIAIQVTRHLGATHSLSSPLPLRLPLQSAQINGISLHNRTSLLPKKCPRPERMEARAYYRPNRMHQYLSATELKNSASEDASVMYGRPTRTT